MRVHFSRPVISSHAQWSSERQPAFGWHFCSGWGGELLYISAAHAIAVKQKVRCNLSYIPPWVSHKCTQNKLDNTFAIRLENSYACVFWAATLWPITLKSAFQSSVKLEPYRRGYYMLLRVSGPYIQGYHFSRPGLIYVRRQINTGALWSEP